MSSKPQLDSWALLIVPACSAPLVILLTIVAAVAEGETAPISTCRYCHPVRCLTSKYCGSGCSCLKTSGESNGVCVPAALAALH